MEKNIRLSQVISTYIDKLDIIGDVHGCYYTLIDLLKKLGYQRQNNVWQHPARLAVFIGDYIDRGLNTRQTLKLIKSMVDNGKAIALLGNHEFNFIAINTLDETGKPYREPHKIRQHKATLDSIPEEERQFWIEWFKTLPLLFETEKLRVIHAAWIDDKVQFIKQHYPTLSLNDNLPQSLRRGTEYFNAINCLLKGPELKNFEHLPIDEKYKQHSGLRIKWWINFTGHPTLDEIIIDPMPKMPAPDEFFDVVKPYPKDAKPLIIGHFTIPEKPHIISGNLTCIDFAAYKKKWLAAYRFNGEKHFTQDNLVYVPYNSNDQIIEWS